MQKNTNRILAVLLTLCLTVLSFSSVSNASGIAPLYNNADAVSSSVTISSSGLMNISYRYMGSSSVTTKAVITTYIEKKTLGLFWTRVDIDQPNNQWVDTINNYRYSGSRTFQLSSKGTYRVTITYKIYGTGGAVDEIPFEIEKKY